MKLYMITRIADGLTTEGGVEPSRQICGWATSDGAASKWCTQMKKLDPDNKPERAAFEVPTTREELVKFLNAFAAPVYCCEPEV